MSRSKNENHEMPVPTLSEMENLLSEIKPRPTARLHQQLRQAPWQYEEGKFSMIRLKRLELVATGAALLLLVVIAAVLLLEWSPTDQINFGGGTDPETNQTAENNAAPLPTRLSPATPTPTPPEGLLAWSSRLPGGVSLSRSGIAYETSAEQGRLFVADGSQGVQIFNLSGENLGTIAITDPETGQPVSVQDIAWDKLLWLSSNEYGLFVLTEPFQTGEYLHAVDPDSKTILSSFTLNNNIAIPATTDLVGELPPTRLSGSGNGELYVERVYTFAPETAGDPATAFHYLLRSVIDGRILNPMLVSQEPAKDEQPSNIADLAYQATTDRLYAAVYQGDHGIVQKFTLTGTPQNLATLNEELTSWQENVALSVDDRGHVYVLVDRLGYIVELDQEDQVVNVYGFRDMAGAVNYPAVSYWLPGEIGRPLAMTVSPDGSMIFVVDQNGEQVNLTAFTIIKETAADSSQSR